MVPNVDGSIRHKIKTRNHQTHGTQCVVEYPTNRKKGKVFNGQEPPSGESTTTDCGVNYQLLAVMYWSIPLGAPSSSQPQPATDNVVRDSRSNWLVAPPILMGSTPERHVHRINQCNLSGTRTCNRSMRGKHLAWAATQGNPAQSLQENVITVFGPLLYN